VIPVPVLGPADVVPGDRVDVHRPTDSARWEGVVVSTHSSFCVVRRPDGSTTRCRYEVEDRVGTTDSQGKRLLNPVRRLGR
jgi:hypothetical protein